MATKVIGLDRLRGKLMRFPEQVREQIADAMEKSAEEIVQTARSLAPVGDTGWLRDSIGWTWGDPPRGSMVLGMVGKSGSRRRRRMRNTRGRNDGYRITIYAGDSAAFYARWVEFGTSPHPQGGMFKGSTHPGTRAQPFFYPAWRANKRRATGRVRRALRTAAKRMASGA